MFFPWSPFRCRYRSDPQDPFTAPDARRAGADGLEDNAGLDRLDERVELGSGTGQLDPVDLVGDVEDAAAEDVGEPLHLLAVLARCADLDQHELALDVISLGQVYNLHD